MDGKAKAGRAKATVYQRPVGPFALVFGATFYGVLLSSLALNGWRAPWPGVLVPLLGALALTLMWYRRIAVGTRVVADWGLGRLSIGDIAIIKLVRWGRAEVGCWLVPSTGRPMYVWGPRHWVGILVRVIAVNPKVHLDVEPQIARRLSAAAQGHGVQVRLEGQPATTLR
jgi:hypothetical protein